MRNGTVIINGTNVSSTYGAYVRRGGYKELFQWPALRSVSGNNWQEYDGFEPDLSNPRIDNREFTVNFVCLGGTGKMLAFYNFLQTQPKMECTFSDVSLTLDLRVVAMPSVDFAKVFNIISVRFACDDALDGHTPSSPSSSMDDNDLYVIDGRPLSDYGVRVLKGTISNVIRQPDIKPLLTRKSSVIDGAEYDENPVLYSGGSWGSSSSHGDVTTEQRDITLRCQLVAATPSQAWHNYYALLGNLIARDENEEDPTLVGSRDIVIRPVGGVFRCYYKSNQVLDYCFADGETWVEFNLTLCLFEQIGTCDIEDGINDAPSGGGGGGGGGGGSTTTIKALGSEDGKLVITENSKAIVLRT